MRKQSAVLALMAVGLMIPAPAHAWDGVVTGQVQALEIANSGNYAFRVMLKGYPNMCGSVTWAYLPEADSSFKLYAALLMAAQARGATVTIYTNRDAASGFCQVGYLSVAS